MDDWLIDWSIAIGFETSRSRYTQALIDGPFVPHVDLWEPCLFTKFPDGLMGELSYLAPLGSENISAPYLKQFFFRGGYYPRPPDWVKHHTSQSQDRNNKYFILYIEFCINNKI